RRVLPIRQEAHLHSITLVDVTAGHGATEVLSRASLTVGEGSRIGVVGPNGVGKTTLLRLLAGLEEPERGRVRLSPPGLSVGYLPQELELGNLSGGQAARARLAALFRADHDVYCLDEPTNDLDFEGLEWLERLVQARSHGRGAGRRGTHAQMTKVRQAERALERVEQVEKPFEPWALHLELEPARRGGDLVVRLEGALVERGEFRLGPIDLDV